MENHIRLENVDEDGYTQLDFRLRGITRRPVSSEKGIFFFVFNILILINQNI